MFLGSCFCTHSFSMCLWGVGKIGAINVERYQWTLLVSYKVVGCICLCVLSPFDLLVRIDSFLVFFWLCSLGWSFPFISMYRAGFVDRYLLKFTFIMECLTFIIQLIESFLGIVKYCGVFSTVWHLLSLSVCRISVKAGPSDF